MRSSKGKIEILAGNLPRNQTKFAEASKENSSRHEKKYSKAWNDNKI